MRFYRKAFLGFLMAALGVVSAAQSPAPSRPSPGLTTDDISKSRSARFAPREGAVTELRIFVESPKGNKKFLFTREESSFYLPEYEMSSFDRNKDGLLDDLHIQVESGGRDVRLEFSTVKTGLNLSLGSYEVPPNVILSKDPVPDFFLRISGKEYFDCGTAAKSKFHILEADFDMSGERPVIISFAARFEQICHDSKVKGNIYYNYVP